jgi:hypothetical protein
METHMTVQEATQIRTLWQRYLTETEAEAADLSRRVQVAQQVLAEAEAALAEAVLREGGV